MSGSWKDTAELLGITAIVASLIFVGLELRQSQRIAFAEQEGAQIGDFMAIDELLSSNAGLIQKANRGEQLTDVELAEVTILAGTLYRSYFFVHQRAVYLDHPSAGFPAMVLARTFYENPRLRELFFEKNEANLEIFIAMRDAAPATVRRGGGDARQFLLDVQKHLETLDQMKGANRQ